LSCYTHTRTRVDDVICVTLAAKGSAEVQVFVLETAQESAKRRAFPHVETSLITSTRGMKQTTGRKRK